MLKEKIDIKVDFYFLILISLKHIADRSYVTLGNRRALEATTMMREIFFQQYHLPISIDEIQRSPKLLLANQRISRQ